MSWRPILGRLWVAEWPYKPNEGVGLLLEGYPPDEEAFRRMTAEHGCHPNASVRILQRMKEAGHDRLTVAAQRDFPKVAADFASVGVKMSIIPPQDGWCNGLKTAHGP